MPPNISAAVASALRAPPLPGSLNFPFQTPPGVLLTGTNPSTGAVSSPLSQLQVQLQTVQSPYPPPQYLKEYEALEKGSWNRILTLVEQAQAAQIKSVEAAQANMRADSQRGNYLGALVTTVAMGCALICALYGHPGVAGAFLSVPVMSVGRALIDSTRGRAASPPQPSQPAEQHPPDRRE